MFREINQSRPKKSSSRLTGGKGASGLLEIMLLMGLFLVVVQVHRAGGSVLAAELGRGRGYSPAELGAIMGAMFLGSAAVQLPAGVLYDRHGPRLVVSVLNLVAVAGILLFAFSSSVPGLIASRILIGIGHGTVIASIYLLAIGWARPERVATVTGTVIALAGGIGGILATAPLALLLAGIGFRATFVSVALLTLAMGGILYGLIRNAPNDSAAAQPKARESLAESLRGLWEIARDRQLRPIFVMGSCFSAPFMAVGGLWAGPYLSDVHHLSSSQASYVLLTMMIALNLGYFIYGPLDRIFNSRKRVVLGSVLSMVTILTFLAAAPALGIVPNIAALLLFSVSSTFYITLAAHCRGFIPMNRVGRAIACINLMGLFGIFSFQISSGLLIDATANDDGSGSVLGYRLLFAGIALILTIVGSYYATVRDVPPREPVSSDLT